VEETGLQTVRPKCHGIAYLRRQEEEEVEQGDWDYDPRMRST